ncbi:MAG: hypothetical protein JW910_13600, partial [Anaerolineae bacterium]|nr:hypothetical protein [Anaerolineae bacterium]
MLKRTLFLLIIMVLALAACGGAETPTDEPVPTGETAAETPTPETASMEEEEAAAPSLTLAGSFTEARAWTWEELEGLGTITATIAGPREDDPEAEYTGVSLTALFEAAGLSEDAATLVA